VDVTPVQDDTGDMSTDRLRELHDEYAWEVNAAISEGREDLVWRLVDDYVEAAMREMTGDYGSGCDRPDCTMCVRPPRPPRRRWFRFGH
jgi:hypothetical protein